MWAIPLGFIMLVLFIGRIIYVRNEDAKLMKSSRQKTIYKTYASSNNNGFQDHKSINTNPNNNIRNLEILMEKSFENNISNALKSLNQSNGNNPYLIQIAITSAIGHTYKSFKQDYSNNHLFKVKVNNEQFSRSLEHIRDKMLNKHLH